ncbi:hypothetical protein CEE37_04970 [candidate division LCP-89 bacterium B3_LCP]|uniref:Secretion system C-terminal sorting domain-containing protein n=1 Tax=candidate division LCP-89 bacterium B3_LCP TaxID=2012998 RepID=A0A532V1K1_UNCL8|nr:MAG: hypothetical protein CEE37_04970 [candidate division LCP-89 bacterium B3_LCP]
MRKMVWILLSTALIFGLQVGTQAAGSNDVEANVVSIQNAEVPAVQTQGNLTDLTLYFEDFESGAVGWTSYDAGNVGDKWHTDLFNAYAGNSWWMGDPLLGGYDNHWLQYLLTPSLDFTDATNPVLTYKLRYDVEAPGGEPPPYDGWDGCNVWVSTDGGTNWSVINPDFPVYNCANLYSFGLEWGMGPGIAGWGGFSGGWVDAQFDLSAYNGQADVMVRFAFASDPAYCTIDDPLLYGYFVDNVSIDDGALNMLYNDADGTATPAEFSTDNGSATGDYWALTTSSSAPPSPVTSMRCDTYTHYGLSDALESPWIIIPIDPLGTPYLSFWLWCNMMDFTGSGGTSLEDYYHVEISTDGIIWNELFYDYGDNTRPGGWGVGWQQYLEGMQFNGNLTLEIYEGQTVKLRWRVITDWDDNGGAGPTDGLYIDDVEVYTIAGLNNDCGTELMHVPMPTSLYFADIGCSVELHNYGLNDQGMIPAFWRENFVPNPLIPWAAIPAGGMELKTWNWGMPGGVGSYFMDAYTMLTGDEDLTNDTSKAGLVDVTAADVLEFGYDSRQYSYEASIYYFNFETGEGPMIRYSPAADGVTDNMDAVSLKGYWREGGTIRIHIYGEGTTTTPGPQITQFDHLITTIYPAWEEIDLSTIPELQGFNHEVWVFYELLNDAGIPHIYGSDYSNFGTDHMFADFGTGMVQSDYDFFGRLVCGVETAYPSWMIDTWLIGGSPVPSGGGNLDWGVLAENTSGQVLNGDVWIDAVYEGTTTIQVIERALVNYQPGWTINRPDNWYPVPAGWPGGNYEWFVRTGVLPSVIWEEDYFDWSKAGAVDLDFDFEANMPLNAPDPFGDLAMTQVDYTVPTEYAVMGTYPNPFNPTTNISFALPADAKVLLSVYDVSGRLVTTLVDGYRNAGIHDVTFDASDLASGIYLYRLEAGEFNVTGKMVLMK